MSKIIESLTWDEKYNIYLEVKKVELTNLIEQIIQTMDGPTLTGDALESVIVNTLEDYNPYDYDGLEPIVTKEYEIAKKRLYGGAGL